MNDLSDSLKHEFQDPDYRYGYAESFLNTKLAVQIKTLREAQGMTQAQVAALMGIKQPGYRRYEDVNHSVWRTDTLWSIARALGVRVRISFETFSSLLEEKNTFHKESLQRMRFEEDPLFQPGPSEGGREQAKPVWDSTAFEAVLDSSESRVEDDSAGLGQELSESTTFGRQRYRPQPPRLPQFPTALAPRTNQDSRRIAS